MLLPTKVGDATVEYFQLDDGGDSTRAVQNAKKLLQEQNVDALIGPSTTPNALAMLELVAEAKVPMMATVGTSSVVEPMDAKRRWVFKTTQNDDLIAAALVEHMAKTGVKTIGFIGYKDPYGENWHKVFTPMAEKAGIKVVAAEYYRRADPSVTGQVLKLIAAKPDAVLVAGVGGPGGCRRSRCATGIQGHDLPDARGRDRRFHPARQGQGRGHGAGGGADARDRRDSDANPIKKVAQSTSPAYEKRFGRSPRPSAPTRGIRESSCSARFRSRAMRQAQHRGIRLPRCANAIEAEREIVRCQGVFNMSPSNHNGNDERARVLVTVKDGKFRLLPE